MNPRGERLRRDELLYFDVVSGSGEEFLFRCLSLRSTPFLSACDSEVAFKSPALSSRISPSSELDVILTSFIIRIFLLPSGPLVGSLSISTEKVSVIDQDSKRVAGVESNQVSVLTRQRTWTQDSAGTRWLQAALP